MKYNDLSIKTNCERLAHYDANTNNVGTAFSVTVTVIDNMTKESTTYKRIFWIDNIDLLYENKCEIADAYTGKCVANYLTSKYI